MLYLLRSCTSPVSAGPERTAGRRCGWRGAGRPRKVGPTTNERWVGVAAAVCHPIRKYGGPCATGATTSPLRWSGRFSGWVPTPRKTPSPRGSAFCRSAVPRRTGRPKSAGRRAHPAGRLRIRSGGRRPRRGNGAPPRARRSAPRSKRQGSPRPRGRSWNSTPVPAARRPLAASPQNVGLTSATPTPRRPPTTATRRRGLPPCRPPTRSPTGGP